MSFLNPGILWFGLAALAPVIIHLFNFRRPRKVVFTRVKFLQNLQKQTKSVNRLKNLLILLLRVLSVLLLVIAFAQPIIPPPAGQAIGTNNAVAIYVDNSHSMMAEVGNKTLLDKAVEVSRQVVELYPPGTNFIVFGNNFNNADYQYHDAQSAIKLISQLNFSQQTKSLLQAQSRLKAIYKQLEPGHVFSGHFYVVSDFQASTLQATQHKPDTLYRNIWLPIQSASASNVFIDSVWFESPFALSDQSNTFFARLKNTGNEPVNEVLVKLFINGEQTASANANLPKNGFADVVFGLQPDPFTTLTGEVKIFDMPVSFDNNFNFVVNGQEPLQVAAVAEDSALAFKALFGNPKLFKFRIFDPKNIDYEYVKTADVVLFNQIDYYDTALSELLSLVAQQNTKVFLIPNKAGFAGNFPYAQMVTTLPPATTDTAATQLWQIELSPSDPLFKGVFEKYEPTTIKPFAVPVISLKEGFNQILPYLNGKTFLGRSNNSNAEIFVFAAPFNMPASNLLRHGMLVPLIYKLAFGNAKATASLYHTTAQQNIRLPFKIPTGDAPIKLTAINGSSEIIPSQLRRPDGVLISAQNGTLPVGLLKATHADSLLGYLAINNQSPESTLKTDSLETLNSIAKQYNNLRVIENESSLMQNQNNIENLKAEFFGKQLWKQAILLVLILILFEILILRFWR